MKRVAILLSVLFLFAGLTFAQEPQKPVKKAEPAKTEKTIEAKKECAHVKKCSSAKKSSCCAHSKKAKTPAKSHPDDK